MNAVHFTYLARLPDERGNSVKFSEEGEGPRATRFFGYPPALCDIVRTSFSPVVYITSFLTGDSFKTFNFQELTLSINFVDSTLRTCRIFDAPCNTDEKQTLESFIFPNLFDTMRENKERYKN